MKKLTMKNGKLYTVVFNTETKQYLKCDNLFEDETKWVASINDATHYPHTFDDMSDLMESAFYDWPFNNCIFKRIKIS